IGPSGSGKSTLLRLLAGLLHPDEGWIHFDGADVTGRPTEKRDVGVVFQSYALFPHLTVRDNVAFGLRTARRKLPPGEAAGRVDEALALLGLQNLAGRRPAELSGGEQQRVAVARAIAPRPALLLFDEPLSALDARLRRSVRADLAALLARLGTTVLYVTHDQEEAMLLAGHLVVLDRGRIVQAGPPLDLYRRPADPFVATFLGEANLLEVLEREGRKETALGPLPALPGSGTRLLVRPEDLEIHPAGMELEVAECRGLGPYDRVLLRLPGGGTLLAHLPPATGPTAGGSVRLALRPGRGHLLAAPGGDLAP
ncbi:MAG TPA: ABC transporter ATP-binding protein, partial [Thermoanaerobaculia bacterium]|nr:ABC transporter ATP-binding protein [Thermoanaerobaculia bacterium]